VSHCLETVATMPSEVGAFGCSGMGGRDVLHPAIRREIARSERTVSLWT